MMSPCTVSLAVAAHAGVKSLTPHHLREMEFLITRPKIRIRFQLDKVVHFKYFKLLFSVLMNLFI